MRFRKTNALVGALVAVGALFMVYLVIDTISVQYEEAELQKVRIDISNYHVNLISKKHIILGRGSKRSKRDFYLNLFLYSISERTCKPRDKTVWTRKRFSY